MADETFELFSITNKLTLDTSQFDRAYNDSRGKMKTLAGEVNKLETASKSGSGGISGLGSALQGLMPSLVGLGGPAGAISIVTVGIGALFTAVAATSTGVWELTQRFSDIGSELQDMADQVNFSTETLGTFQGVGKSVGVEVGSLSAGLVAFQKNLLGGNDALKALGVTSKNNEEALRQTFKALSQVTDATMQSALAAEVFGTRGGKSMLALIKQTGGDLDAATEKLRKWNVLMSDQAVAIADEFGDKLGELGLRFQGIGNTIATETAPAFIAAFSAIEAALDSDVIEWRWWGEQIGDVIVGATAVISGFTKAVQDMDMSSGPLKFIADWTAGTIEARDELNKRRGELLQGTPEGMGGGRIPGPTIDWNPSGNKKGKTGKSEAQREAEREQRELERLMEQRGDMIERMNMEYKRLSDQLQGVDTATRSYAVAESQLTGILKDASPELIKQAEAIAKSVDNRQKQLNLQNQLAAFLKQQDAAVRLAIDGERSHSESVREFITQLEREGAVLQDVTKWWMAFKGLILDSADNMARLAENIDKVLDKFPLPEIIFPTQTEGEIATGAGEAANREAGLPPEMRESTLLKWRRLVEDFSHDITYTIDRAIERGFEDGIGAGIKEFGLGILEMARHEALGELQKAIARALGGDAEQNEAGGGIFSTLINFGLKALGGLFGGGGASGGLGAAAAGGIGGKAGGGFVYPNEWSIVGERGPELIKAGSRGASVMSNAETTGKFGSPNVYMTVYARDAESFARRETQTQIKNRLRRNLAA